MPRATARRPRPAGQAQARPTRARPPARPERPRRAPRARAPRERRPKRSGGIRRWLFRPSALVGVAMVLALAVVVAFVSTLVYASVDAGRPLAGGLNAGPRSGDTVPFPVTEPQTGPTTTRAPENLTPEQLTAKVSPSTRVVRTRDEAGQPVEGTAFVVGSFGGQTLLLTSLAVVRAGTRAPAPPITLGDSQQATLWTWEEARDLALLVVGGSIEGLTWSNSSEPVKAGERIYSVRDGKLSVGVVSAASAAGIEHNIFVEDALQGAPIVNQKGEVLAVASRAYNPSGRGTDTLFTAVPVNLSCERVIRCGSGNTGPGATTTTSRP